MLATTDLSLSQILIPYYPEYAYRDTANLWSGSESIPHFNARHQPSVPCLIVGTHAAVLRLFLFQTLNYVALYLAFQLILSDTGNLLVQKGGLNMVQQQIAVTIWATEAHYFIWPTSFVTSYRYSNAPVEGRSAATV